MALAHLLVLQSGPDRRVFAAELGSNRYWRVAVGGERRRDQGGVELLAEPRWISPLHGPLPPESLGRTTIEIGEERFDRDNRFVQLMSYRDSNGNGPAVSAILESHGGLPLQFGALSPVAPSTFGHTAREVQPARWQPAARPAQMGFDVAAIVGMIGPILAKAVPLLKTALPGLASAAAPAAAQLLNALVGGAGAAGGLPLPGSAPAPQPAPAATPPALQIDRQTAALLIERLAELAQPAQEKGSRAQALRRLGVHGGYGAARRRAAALSLRGGRPQLSRAAVAPAIPALLTTLLPLLQQVLTPETVQAVLNAPNEHLKTVFNGMKDAAKLGIESHEQDLQFLRDINPGVDDPALDSLLAGLSQARSRSDPGRVWKRAESVRLAMPRIATVPVAGQLVTLLAADRPLRFPLEVTLPVDGQGRTPSLRDAAIQLQVKDKETLEVLHQQEWPAGSVSGSGAIATVPAVAASALAGVPRNVDLLFCFALVWSTSRGEARGASIQHLARLCEGYSFERLLGDSSRRIRLADEAAYGDYQHIVWSNRLRDDARRVLGELRYFYVLAEDDMPLHRRQETEVASRGTERTPTRREVRLQSGFEVSLEALIKLAAVLDPAGEPVAPEMRAALADLNFRNAFDRAARLAFDFRASPGDVFELRTIPTFEVQQLVFRKAGAFDELGQVVSQEEVTLGLPVPVSLELEVRNSAAAPGAEPISRTAAELTPSRMMRRPSAGGKAASHG